MMLPFCASVSSSVKWGNKGTQLSLNDAVRIMCVLTYVKQRGLLGK
jgi:hypothetical protein